MILLIVLVVGICYLFIATDPNKDKKNNDVEKEDIYQQALLGHKDKAIKNFSKLSAEDMSKNDKSIYANLLIDKGDFDKAVDVKNEKYVENKNFIMTEILIHLKSLKVIIQLKMVSLISLFMKRNMKMQLN